MFVPSIELAQNLSDLEAFLGCKTPVKWLQAACEQLDILLIDHAHCEKKAASTAMQLMFRYPTKATLLTKMSRLAREELLHFDQVCRLMKKRGVTFDHLPPSSYAASLHKHVRTYEPYRLIDILIIGAFVEGRSCERFAALIPYLEERDTELPKEQKLAKFYVSLLKSEARHYQDYLHLADVEMSQTKVTRAQREACSQYGESGQDTQTYLLQKRIAEFRAIEAKLILAEDSELRFHSGVVQTQVA